MTVIKVFLFDIGTLQRGYRIAAFMVLGIICWPCHSSTSEAA